MKTEGYDRTKNTRPNWKCLKMREEGEIICERWNGNKSETFSTANRRIYEVVMVWFAVIKTILIKKHPQNRFSPIVNRMWPREMKRNRFCVDVISSYTLIIHHRHGRIQTLTYSQFLSFAFNGRWTIFFFGLFHFVVRYSVVKTGKMPSIFVEDYRVCLMLNLHFRLLHFENNFHHRAPVLIYVQSSFAILYINV